MAARYVRIGQYPDIRDEIRGTLAEILALSTPNVGAFANPDDVAGCSLEVGADGKWKGSVSATLDTALSLATTASLGDGAAFDTTDTGGRLSKGSDGKLHGTLGSLTSAQAAALQASGALANVASGTTGDRDGVKVTWGGSEAGFSGYKDQFGVYRPAPKLPQIAPFKLASMATKFAAIQNATGVMTICGIGESTTKGEGSNGSTSSTENPTAGSWVAHLADTLRRVTGMHISEVHCPKAGGAGNYDGRWIASGGFAYNSFGNALSSAYHSTTAAATLSFSDAKLEEWDTATVWFLQSPSYTGSGTIEATGGSTVAFSSYNSTRRYFSYSCKASSVSNGNSVKVTTNDAGAVTVVAVELYNSTRGSRIRVANFGVGGSDTSDWIADTGTGIKGYWVANALSPDLLLICMGGNESSNGVSSATHLSRMQTLVTGVAPSCGAVGVLSITPRIDEAKRALVDQYVAGYASLTASNLVNYSDKTWAAWRNYLPPSMGGSVHLGSPGYKWVADVIADQLIY